MLIENSKTLLEIFTFKTNLTIQFKGGRSTLWPLKINNLP